LQPGPTLSSGITVLGTTARGADAAPRSALTDRPYLVGEASRRITPPPPP